MFRCYITEKKSVKKLITFLFFSGFINLLTAQIQHPSFEPLFTTNTKTSLYSSDVFFEISLLFSECEKEVNPGIDAIRIIVFHQQFCICLRQRQLGSLLEILLRNI